jgi:hypothetical protein
MAANTPADPYVRGWHDCAETIARLCELKANDLLANRPRIRDRILNQAIAAVYRHAAEIARATTEVDRASATPASAVFVHCGIGICHKGRRHAGACEYGNGV